MAKMVNMGIVGTGRIGQIHAKNLLTRFREANLVAVADVDEKSAQQVALKCGGIKWYKDFEQMLEKEDINAVLVCVSTNIHKDIIVYAAQKGKHIFCEKPIALTLKETNEILAAVEKAGVLMQVGFMRRFDPALSSAKEEIDKGSIGKPLLFKAVSRDPEGPPLEYARVSGGLFVDSSIHDIDLARWFMGSEVEKVYAEGKTLIYPEFKEFGDVDVAFTTLTFKNGSLGNIENSRRSGYGYDVRVEIAGSEGALQIGYLRHHRFFLLKKPGVNYEVIPSWQERFKEAFVNEMRHFVDCIINHKVPIVTGIDARKALEIALAATKSSQESTPVTLSWK
ncbi:MAG: inositol 2-dehydrogenase [Candidatus Aerophobetes bacterium]|nr:inositol 2-dehydrogenase [Candidatus Aerophobetes bacterium]